MSTQHLKSQTTVVLMKCLLKVCTLRQSYGSKKPRKSVNIKIYSRYKKKSKKSKSIWSHASKRGSKILERYLIKRITSLNLRFYRSQALTLAVSKSLGQILSLLSTSKLTLLKKRKSSKTCKISTRAKSAMLLKISTSLLKQRIWTCQKFRSQLKMSGRMTHSRLCCKTRLDKLWKIFKSIRLLLCLSLHLCHCQCHRRKMIQRWVRIFLRFRQTQFPKFRQQESLLWSQLYSLLKSLSKSRSHLLCLKNQRKVQESKSHLPGQRLLVYSKKMIL